MKNQLNIKNLSLLIFIALITISCNTVERDWEKANDENSIESYNEFISNHPDNEYIDDAKIKIEQFEWENAKVINTIYAYQQFLSSQPSVAYSDSASRAISIIEYKRIKNSSNIDSLQSFVNKYPLSEKSAEIQKKIKKIEFDNILINNNVNMLYTFLKNNPAFIQLINKKNWTKLSSLVKVSYSYKTFHLFQVQDQKTGNWVYPTTRVYYGKGYSKNTINATVSSKKYKCLCLYQDIAIYKRNTKFPVFAYQGCPFSIKRTLSVEKDVKFEKNLTITIDSATNNVLWVSDESAFPFIYNDGNLFPGYYSAINTTWVFLNKGELFFAGNEAYITLKDSAQIQFTNKGLKIVGLKKYMLNK